jgi:hypothetical protein
MIMICFYQDASAVEEKVKELQDRVCHLMVVIVDNVTAKCEDGSKEAIVKAAECIEGDIRDLLRCAFCVWSSETTTNCWVPCSTLTTINHELTEIREQNGWLTALYKDLNMSRVESCLERLSTALERFKACS